MLRELTKGLVKENPIFIIMLGLCPTMAISNQVTNGLGMGAATIFVLVCSSLLISMLRKVIPNEVRLATYILIIATFVTISDLVMQAYFPLLSKTLGAFVPLIVVNCIILGRAEAFAGKVETGLGLRLDGIGMGIGFTALPLSSPDPRGARAGTITLFPIASMGFDGVVEVPGLKQVPCARRWPCCRRAAAHGIPQGALRVARGSRQGAAGPGRGAGAGRGRGRGRAGPGRSCPGWAQRAQTPEGSERGRSEGPDGPSGPQGGRAKTPGGPGRMPDLGRAKTPGGPGRMSGLGAGEDARHRSFA